MFKSRIGLCAGVSLMALALGLGAALAAPDSEILAGGGAGSDRGGGGGGFGPGGNPGGADDGGDGVSPGAGGAVGPGGVGGGVWSGPGSLSMSYSGGHGGNGSAGGGGGGGGTGLRLTGGGTVDTNGQNIRGGNGGISTLNGAGGGGVGLLIQDGGTVIVHGSTITGGGSGGLSAFGGEGGAGAFLMSGGAIDNVSGTISGGTGSRADSLAADAGRGGAGVLANGGRIENASIIKGGQGGYHFNDRHGSGGSGVEVWGSDIVNQASGQILGGHGAPLNNNNDPVYASVGGTAVVFRAQAAGSLFNAGMIAGGDGGAVDGSGGMGVYVVGDGVRVINAGSIAGGMGSTRARAVQIDGNNNTLELWQGYSFTGDVVSGGSNNSLAFGGTVNGTFDVTQIGALFSAAQFQGFDGFQKIGKNTWTLTGTSTVAEPWTVDGGVLSVNGSIASSALITVNASGTLAGNGTVGNTVINAGGTLSPGNSIGLLTVQGDLTFMAGSTYLVEVSPASADRVNVSGVAALNGATLSAFYEPGAYVAKRYTVLNAAGGVNGMFAGPVNTNLPANFTAAVNYDTNNAYLDLALNYTPGPGDPGPTAPNFGGALSLNQAHVAQALVNSFNTAGGIPLVFGGLNPSGLTQASGEAATAIQQTTIDVMDRFINVMSDPYASGRATVMVPMSYAPVARGMQPLLVAPQPRWSVWATGYGGTQTTRGNAFIGSATNTAGIYGFAAGADYRVAPDTVLGFALGAAGTSYHLANGLGSGLSNIFQLGLHGRQNFGPAYVAGSLAYGWQDVTTDRRVLFDQLRARFNAHSFAGRLETGYRFGMGLGGLTPYAAGQFTTVSLPAYQEQAIAGPGLFALSYGSKSVIAWRTELGLRADKAIDLGDAMLFLRGRLAWAHHFNPDRSISASFLSLPASGFIVNGAASARNAALVSAGAEMKWRNGWSIAATFEGSFSTRGNGYAGKGALRYQW